MFSPSSSLRRKPLAVLVHAALLSAFALSVGHAATFTVTSNADAGAGSLRNAVTASSSGDTIVFDCSPVALNCPAVITLSSQGNNQGFPGPTALAIKGKAITIEGSEDADLTLLAATGITSATSLRHFFVDNDASLTLRNVTLSGGLAKGGNGGMGYGGGGGAGGLGGAIFNQGGLILKNVKLVGNDAFGGYGGGYYNTIWSYGGGGGLGGGGCKSLGGGGGTGGYGKPGVWHTGGIGGPGLNGLGGGSGSENNGSDGSNGGGGGAGYSRGGSGSDGGGGGAGYTGGGGCGGFGGGGGGSRYAGGGCGGFGGGGGAALSGGAGGVGGGGGGSQAAANTRPGPGGGGAGFGGAVFVRAGGTLRIEESSAGGTMGSNSVTAGYGNSAGAAAGSGLFLMSGVPAVFDIGGRYTISDSIADDSAAALPAGHGYTAGAGAGAGITKQGPGILILSGKDAYAGMTSVNEGILRVTGSIAGSAVSIAASGTLTGDGTTGAIDSFGTLVPGNLSQLQGDLAASSLAVEAGALTCFHALGTGAAVSHLTIAGAANVNGIARIDFGSGPSVGTKLTLIQADSIAGTFSGYETNMPNLYGVFEYTAKKVTFTVTGSDALFSSGMEETLGESPCIAALQ